jgi:hypothetical protein
MNVVSHYIDLGRQFAGALDARDYARAAGFLAVDCRYERTGQETLFGPHAICDSYRQSDVRAQCAFDSVVYRSEASSDVTGGIRLTFFDELVSGVATHVFRCAQIVYFDENQKVERISLVEIVGERDRLNAFCAAHGIELS